MDVTFHGSSFFLRPFDMPDVPGLLKHANNAKIAMNLRDGFPHPYTEKDAVNWIRMVMDNRADLILAIEVNGEACGGIGLHGGKDVYRFNAEIGYWLSERHWGKGIISEAVRFVVDHGFTHHKWTRIHAGVFSSNPASMRVLEKCGFTREAIFRKSVLKGGNYLDEHVYSILKEAWLENKGE